MNTIRTCWTCSLILLAIPLFGQSGDTIYYYERQIITWDDFKGIPVDSIAGPTLADKVGLGLDVYNVNLETWTLAKLFQKRRALLADLATTIQVRMAGVEEGTGVITFRAYAVAFKNLSWVNPKFKMEHILRHQQLYFDISELVAREFETAINKEKITTSKKKKVDRIFALYSKLLAAVDEKYAIETSFGEKSSKQQEWENRIHGALSKTK